MITLIIDTETAPLEGITPPQFEAPATYKKPEAIAEWLERKLESWRDTLALHAETGRVLAVGWLDDGTDSSGTIEGDEAGILRDAWAAISGADIVVGHNLRGFDLPFLIRRSFIRGVTLPPGLFEGRYLASRFRDTMDAWACGVREDRISLDNLARALGVGAKTGNGAHFAETYATDREAALEYLAHDLELTRLCAERMGLLS